MKASTLILLVPWTVVFAEIAYAEKRQRKRGRARKANRGQRNGARVG